MASAQGLPNASETSIAQIMYRNFISPVIINLYLYSPTNTIHIIRQLLCRSASAVSLLAEGRAEDVVAGKKGKRNIEPRSKVFQRDS